LADVAVVFLYDLYVFFADVFLLVGDASVAPKVLRTTGGASEIRATLNAKKTRKESV